MLNRLEIETKYGVIIEPEAKIGRSNFYNIILPDGSILESHVKSMIRVEYLCNQYFREEK